MKKQKFKEMKALKGKIRECGMTYRSISPEIPMTPATLSNKLNGYAVFNSSEIQEIARLLNIDKREYGRFFFPDSMRNATKQNYDA